MIETIAIGPELAKALVAAHAEIHNPKTDSENTYFSSKYTSLGACRNATVPVLAKHGLAIMQDLSAIQIVDVDDKKIWATECRTVLVHESGQAVALGPLTLPAKEGTAQALGSAGTYSRRYSLCGATSIAPAEDDDDANAASQPTQFPPTPMQPSRLIHDSGLPPRPAGMFAYGKKFVNVPWNVMNRSDLEWFRDADRTPAIIRDRCKAELAWRDADQKRADDLRTQQETSDRQAMDHDDSDHIPF